MQMEPPNFNSNQVFSLSHPGLSATKNYGLTTPWAVRLDKDTLLN